MMREKSSYFSLRSLVKGQDHSFFKDLTDVFCTVGGTLVQIKDPNEITGLIIYPAQEFTCMETSPSPLKGCKILAYARH
jgi:hypothetical protein